MVLITQDKTVYVNEAAREKLMAFWPRADAINLDRLIPMMAEELADGVLSGNGVKTVPNRLIHP